MPDKIAPGLRARLDAATDQAQPIPVIVTLSRTVAVERLQATGLRIANVFESIHAVAGAIAPRDVARLEAVAEVTRIEHDAPGVHPS